MKKIGKILAIFVGILVLVVIVIAIALPLLIDPNNYKNQIIQAVKQQTGRELKIGGKIGWSVFPWIGVEMRQLELSNAPGFGNQPFARIETAGVKVKLLPLLKKEVVVDKVLLAGLNLNLAKDRTGKTNWDDLAAKKPAAAPGEGGGKPAINAVSIGGVDLRAGEISWKDQTTGAAYTLHKVELKSGALDPAKPVDIKLGLDLESTAPAFRTHIDLKTRVTVDLDKQTLAVSDLVLEAAGLKLKANAVGARILSAPQFSGNLELASFNPRAFLEKIGVKVETTDKKALGQAALTTKFDATGKQARLPDVSAVLDDSKLNGSLEIINFAQPFYRFNLILDNFDLDRYLSPAGQTEKSPDPGANKPQPAGAPAPLDAIRQLNAQGQFRIGKFKAFGLRASDMLIGLTAKDGLVRLTPTQAKLYSGGLNGTVSLDARQSTPVSTFDEQLTGVGLAPLLKDAGISDKFSGTGNINMKLNGRGLDANNIKASLTGTTEFSVKDGTFTGIDLKKTADQIKQARKEGVSGLKNIIPQKADQTKFSQLSASAQIKNGVAQSDDLVVQVPGLVKVTGKGNANLAKDLLDYVIYVEDIPIKITGALTDPKFTLDVDSILKGEAQKKLKQEGKKLEDQLRDRLKNLRIK